MCLKQSRSMMNQALTWLWGLPHMRPASQGVSINASWAMTGSADSSSTMFWLQEKPEKAHSGKLHLYCTSWDHEQGTVKGDQQLKVFITVVQFGQLHNKIYQKKNVNLSLVALQRAKIHPVLVWEQESVKKLPQYCIPSDSIQNKNRGILRSSCNDCHTAMMTCSWTKNNCND